MTEPTTVDLITWLQRLGTFSFGSLAALIIYGGYKGIWVWGHDYRRDCARLEKERDEWKGIALRHLLVAEKALPLAQPQLPPQVGG